MRKYNFVKLTLLFYIIQIIQSDCPNIKGLTSPIGIINEGLQQVVATLDFTNDFGEIQIVDILYDDFSKRYQFFFVQNIQGTNYYTGILSQFNENSNQQIVLKNIRTFDKDDIFLTLGYNIPDKVDAIDCPQNKQVFTNLFGNYTLAFLRKFQSGSQNQQQNTVVVSQERKQTNEQQKQEQEKQEEQRKEQQKQEQQKQEQQKQEQIRQQEIQQQKEQAKQIELQREQEQQRLREEQRRQSQKNQPQSTTQILTVQQPNVQQQSQNLLQDQLTQFIDKNPEIQNDPKIIFLSQNSSKMNLNELQASIQLAQAVKITSGLQKTQKQPSRFESLLRQVYSTKNTYTDTTNLNDYQIPPTLKPIAQRLQQSLPSLNPQLQSQVKSELETIINLQQISINQLAMTVQLNDISPKNRIKKISLRKTSI